MQEYYFLPTYPSQRHRNSRHRDTMSLQSAGDRFTKWSSKAQTFPRISLSLPQEDTKQNSFMDTKKEELIKAIKRAMQHKEEARKKTAEEWKREGIKGKVILI